MIKSDFQGEREPGGAWAPLQGLRWFWERPFFRMVSVLFALGNPALQGLLLLVVLLA
jgi:hypothetical protein